MTPEKTYDQIMHRFKREADMPVLFTNLTEEQKVLVEMICDGDGNEEKVIAIVETVSWIKNDLDFVLHELNKIS